MKTRSFQARDTTFSDFCDDYVGACAVSILILLSVSNSDHHGKWWFMTIFNEHAHKLTFLKFSAENFTPLQDSPTLISYTLLSPLLDYQRLFFENHKPLIPTWITLSLESTYGSLGQPRAIQYFSLSFNSTHTSSSSSPLSPIITPFVFHFSLKTYPPHLLILSFWFEVSPFST